MAFRLVCYGLARQSNATARSWDERSKRDSARLFVPHGITIVIPARACSIFHWSHAFSQTHKTRVKTHRILPTTHIFLFFFLCRYFSFSFLFWILLRAVKSGSDGTDRKQNWGCFQSCSDFGEFLSEVKGKFMQVIRIRFISPCYLRVDRQTFFILKFVQLRLSTAYKHFNLLQT